MALITGDLYARVRHLIPEMLRFGVVGGIGAVFDLGGAGVLHGMYGESALEAKGISTVVAGVITYLLSRYWTFRGRDAQELKRQAAWFVGLNAIALIVAEAVVGLVTNVGGLHGQVAFNLASFFGTGLGTIFRYVTYRKWVFVARDEDTAVLPTTGVPRPFPDYPPWELDPSFLGLQRASAPAPVPVSWKPALAPAMSGSAPRPQAAPWELELAVSTARSAPEPALARRSGGGRHRKR